jgi:hypothetical protein
LWINFIIERKNKELSGVVCYFVVSSTQLTHNSKSEDIELETMRIPYSKNKVSIDESKMETTILLQIGFNN